MNISNVQRFVVLIVMSATFTWTSPVTAQLWVPVPECAAQCSPGDTGGDCPPLPVWACARFDSNPFVITQGTPGIATGNTLVCSTCCPSCDCDNPPSDTHTCLQTVSVSETRSFSHTVATGIEAGIPAIKASLEYSFGYQGSETKTWEVTAGADSMPTCQIRHYQAQIQLGIGAQHAIEHTHQWWVQTYTPPSCSTPAGYVFVKECPSTQSTTVSTMWGNSYAQLLGIWDCDDPSAP